MVSAISILALLALSGHVTTYSDGTKELIFVQTLWRHGDRSPTKTFPTDPFQEDAWTFGGGGWGQLSPAGMKQHLNLGKMLRSRYVGDYQFFPTKYNAKQVTTCSSTSTNSEFQIYVRSTDVNRTIISAMSNLLGQYGQNDGSSVPDVDYPNITGWPTGYVPIAVHTVDDDTDHLGNMEATCPFREQVWNLAKTSDEVKNFINSEKVQSMLGNLTKFTGQTVDIDNLWIITNALYIEQIYYNDTIRTKNTWFTDDLYAQADAINDQVQLYQNGIFKTVPNVVNGHDVGVLTRKVRGGPILDDMVMHMNIKLDCQGKTTPNCTWINNLKNYVYSAHDTTIYAFFSALLIEEYAVKPNGGYPLYSAAVLLELYIDHADNKPYFKMVYHEQENSGFKDITMGIQGCPNGTSYCSLDILRNFAQTIKPDQPIDQWCYTDLDAKHAGMTTVSLFLIAVILAIQNDFMGLF
ncbi:CRE-PHO-1 protein [Caenorhabditis remanei]|uniref:CRE-PHO-1 protein n=1 Tax=Caenorhabditis remanei TaxID=31234 RepID=E3M4H8_CAERE|nr:CRE-PHO-1 protein [Caenorhabditis remanei]